MKHPQFVVVFCWAFQMQFFFVVVVVLFLSLLFFFVFYTFVVIIETFFVICQTTSRYVLKFVLAKVASKISRDVLQFDAF